MFHLPTVTLKVKRLMSTESLCALQMETSLLLEIMVQSDYTNNILSKSVTQLLKKIASKSFGLISTCQWYTSSIGFESYIET